MFICKSPVDWSPKGTLICPTSYSRAGIDTQVVCHHQWTIPFVTVICLELIPRVAIYLDAIFQAALSVIVVRIYLIILLFISGVHCFSARSDVEYLPSCPGRLGGAYV